MSNLHEMAVRLRPASLDHLGLVTALEQYISDFSRQHNLDVQFETVGMTGKRHALEIETAIFRIVQESLTNVAAARPCIPGGCAAQPAEKYSELIY